MLLMGTAIDWTPELQESVIKSIESGSTLREAAKEHGFSAALILKKVRAIPSFREQYVRAMNDRTDADFEELVVDLFEEPERGKYGIDPAWVQLKRLRVDTIKWALSKRNPKKYGERIQQEISGSLDIAGAVEAARKRAEKE